MKTSLLLAQMLLVSFFFTLSAQAQVICGNQPISDQQRQTMIEAIRRYEAANQQARPAASINYFPIKVHIIRTSAGMAKINWTAVVQQVARLNQFYLKAGIQFYFCRTAPDYIDNDQYYDQTSQKSSVLETELMKKYGVADAINLFIVHNLFDTVGGRASLPGSDIMTNYLILSDDGFIYSDFFLHEMGHYFGLLHTHDGYDRPDIAQRELVTRGTGANCSTAGDMLCDTPADPFPLIKDNLAGSFTNYNCDSYINTLVRDANNAIFKPDTRIIMSYYNSGFYKMECTRYFTDGQFNRMNTYGIGQRTASGNAYQLNCPAMAVIAPTNLVAVRSGSNVQLTWKDMATDEAGYFIERANQATSDFTIIGGVGPNETSFQDAQAEVGQMYHYRVKPANSLTTVSSVAVNQNLSCSMRVKLTGNNFVCNKQATTLIASITDGSGPHSYQWKLNDSVLSETGGTLTAQKAGVYSVTATDSKGCTALSDSKYVQNLNSIAPYLLEGSLSFCQGGVALITIPGVYGHSGARISWTVDGKPITGIFGLGDTLDIRNPGLYKAHVQVECLDTTYNFPVTVWPLPKPVITGNASICNGQSTVLTASVTGGTLPYSYQWRLNNGIVNETRNTLSAQKGGTYAVSVTDGKGCQAISPNFVVTTQSPSKLYIYKSGSLSFCQGGGVAIGVPGANIRWTMNGNPINGVPGTGDTLYVNKTGVYLAHVQSGCLDTTIAFPVTVWMNPKVFIYGESSTICPNSSIDLVNVVDGGAGQYTYHWLKNGQPISSIDSTFSVSDAATYQSIVQDRNGCTATSTPYKVTVSSLRVSIVPPGNFCSGNADLKVRAEGGNPPYTYQWQQGTKNVGVNNETLPITEKGDYSISVTDANTCKITTLFTVKEIGKVPALITPAGSISVYAPKTVLLQANVGSNLTYQWIRNGNSINGATNSAFEAKESGTYTVIVSRGDGCSSVSEPVVVTVEIVLASEPITSQADGVVLVQNQPNPVERSSTIQFRLPQRLAVTLTLLTLEGRVLSVLAKGEYANGWHKVIVDLGHLPEGVYLYRLQTEQGNYIRRLLITR